MDGIATFVKSIGGKRGNWKLFHLSPPMEEEEYDFGDHDYVKVEYEYVIVSATNAMFSGPETYIFGSNEKGEVENWGELRGSYRGGLDHELALLNAGYSTVEYQKRSKA